MRKTTPLPFFNYLSKNTGSRKTLLIWHYLKGKKSSKQPGNSPTTIKAKLVVFTQNKRNGLLKKKKQRHW